MMKKLFIYSSVVGLAAGAIYLLCKKEKSNVMASKSMDNKSDFEQENHSEGAVCEPNVMEEMYQTKSESAQMINYRHTEASEIMTDALKNIFSEIEPVVFDDEVVDTVIDNESVEIIKELDSLSDELDELLK